MAFLYSGSLCSSLYCGVSSLWVGLYGWLVKVSWLGKLVSVFGGWSWVSSLWSEMKCPVMSYEMSVGLEWLWAACILKPRAMFLCCWRICVVHLALGLVGLWVVLGFSVWRCLMSSYWLMFPGVGSSLVFSGFGLKPPANGFQSYSCSHLKTSPSVTSKAGPSVLASHVCWSLQCLISTLIQGSVVDTCFIFYFYFLVFYFLNFNIFNSCFRLTCSVVLWGGRNTANK